MKNQLLNLKMIALMCLMMVLGGAKVWAVDAKITIDASKINGFTNSYKEYSWADGEISGKCYAYKNNSNMQFNDNPYVYNISEVPGRIKSVTITMGGGTARSWSVYMAGKSLTSKNYQSEGTKIGNSQTVSSNYTWKVPEGSDYNYFYITKGSRSTQISSIVITYEVRSTPALKTSLSILDFGAVENNTSKDLSFKLSGTKLTADATLSVDGEYFTVAPTTVAQTDGTIAETDVTVSYKPTAVGSHTATLTISSTGAKDKTITLTGTSANAYNVAWNVNGKAYSEGTPTTKVVDGEKVTVLPTAPSDINGKVFVGWTNASLSVAQDAAPAVLFKNVVNAPKVTGDVTYYAVFANRTDGGEVTYTKLTSDQFNTDATYVIGAEKSATDNTILYFCDYENNNSTQIDWGITTSTPSVVSPVTFTLSGSASALIAKDNNGNYLAPLTSKKFSMSSEEEKISLSTEGDIQNPSNNSWKLRYNTSGGLRWYSSDTGTLAYFYEVNKGYIYSGYCTTVEAAAEPTYTAQTLTFIAKDGSTYYATFSSDKVTFITSKHVIPNVVTVANGKVEMKSKMFKSEKTTIESAEVDGYYIPANTGILLYSDAENVDYYTVENKTVDAISPVDNMLEPAPKNGGYFAFNEGYKYYKLAYNNYEARTGLGFYWGANNGGAFYVKGGTAYLKVLAATTAGAKGFTLNGEATGIEGVNANVENAKAIYNLNGQRVASMAKPGLYIVNGKKVVRK